MLSPYALKNNNNKRRFSNSSDQLQESNSNNGRVLRKRRSGLRSNKKNNRGVQINNHNHTAVDPKTKLLRAIPEVEEQKDISSSEKPKLTHKLLCETIIEEKADLTLDVEMDDDNIDHDSFDDDDEEEDISSDSS